MAKRNPVFKTVVITVTPTAIEPAEKAVTFWLRTPSGNAGDVTLTDPEGGTVAIAPGETSPAFEGVDLNVLLVSGTDSDILQVYGFTPWL